jgi:hypothetical protein
LAELVKTGQVTPDELLDAAIQRVEARNGAVNAVISQNVERARKSIADGLPDGPFKGVPYLLKDLGGWLAGDRVTRGSRFFTDTPIVAQNSVHVDRLIASGLVIFGIPYAASLASFGASKHAGDDNLWIPVAGPWLDLADRGGLPQARDRREDEITNRALLVADGVFQALGAVAIVGAFIFPELREKHLADETAKTHLRMTPMKLGRESYGVGAVGTF